MKNLILFVFAMFFISNVYGQRVVYKNGAKTPFYKEDSDITFDSNPTLEIADKKGKQSGLLIALLPSIVDLGFKIGTDILEKNAQKFSAEYAMQKSYLGAANRAIPDFTFERKVQLKQGGDLITAIKVIFSTAKVEGVEGFVYYIKDIELDYSKAKTTSKWNFLDYTFEIKPTFIVDGEKEVQELPPLTINSVEFKNSQGFEERRHRTAFIAMPAGSVFAGVSVKIVESNPAKVRAEQFHNMATEYGDDVKTIVKEILPKEEEDSDSDQEQPASEEPNEPVGNR